MEALADQLPGLAKDAKAGRLSRDAIDNVSQEFEAVFLSTMLEQMFAGLETDGAFGGGQAEETWRSVMIEEYGRSVASAGGIGVADDIARELLAIQEANSHDKSQDDA